MTDRWVNVEPELRSEFPTVYWRPIDGGAWIGPGWVTLMRELSDELESMFAAFPEAERPVVQCIKQKLGGLRFGISKGTEAIHNAIARAEVASENVCELCGLPGSGVNQRGWLSVMCAGCQGG